MKKINIDYFLFPCHLFKHRGGWGVPPILLLINIDHVTGDYIKRTPSPLEATLHNPWCAKDVSEEEEKVHDTFFIVK